MSTPTFTRPMQLIVLAKEPIAGRVKTRLCPPYTPEQAAALAGAAIADTLDAALASGASEVIVVLDGEPGDWLPRGVRVVRQHGGGLDERLANAWDDCGGPGLQIGMDTPQVTAEILNAALAKVDAGSSVLGLATDGGWWAIGFQRPDRELFLGVPMSSDLTGRLQHQRMIDLGHTVALLEPMCDVDTADDARAVAAQIPDTRFGKLVHELHTSHSLNSDR
jgi:uncharacterized protein